MKETGSRRSALPRLAGPTEARYRRALPGFTFVEVMAVLMILLVVGMGVYQMAMSGWRAYASVMWQNRVNMEARQTLDELCDAVRVAGAQTDTTYGATLSERQLGANSNKSRLVFHTNINQDNSNPPWTTATVEQHPATGTGHMRVKVGDQTADSIGVFIDEVRFDYELRDPSPDGQWKMRVVPGDQIKQNELARVTTVYVTVKSSIAPYGSTDMTYSRIFSSAVHMRAPYASPLPFAPRIIADD